MAARNRCRLRVWGCPRASALRGRWSREEWRPLRVSSFSERGPRATWMGISRPCRCQGFIPGPRNQHVWGSAQRPAFLARAALPTMWPTAGLKRENHLSREEGVKDWPLGTRKKRNEGRVGGRGAQNAGKARPAVRNALLTGCGREGPRVPRTPADFHMVRQRPNVHTGE